MGSVLFCHPERSEGSRGSERRDPSVATLPQDDMFGEIETLPADELRRVDNLVIIPYLPPAAVSNPGGF